MESQHGQYVGDREVLPFHSGATSPMCKLSNFYECVVEYKGVWYPSSEHAFQAQRVPAEMREAMFGVHSEIGKLTPQAFEAVGVKKEKCESKKKFWGKKHMIGILAKMRINRIPGDKKLHFDKEKVERVFKEILMAKYKSNMELKDILLATEDKYLLEFTRAAFRKNLSEPPRWAGGVDKETKKIVGENQMGALMMFVRDELRL